jgi:23S rRNA (cytidine2498-2'-O)-methyltransferase
MPESDFLYCACQIGAERALKAELARTHPGFKLAFSRPGYVTFKLPELRQVGNVPDPLAVFARRTGLSMSKVLGNTDSERAASVQVVGASFEWNELHLWLRNDRQAEALPAASEALLNTFGLSPEHCELHGSSARLIRTNGATGGAPLVLDCAIVEPNEWWLGCHQAVSPQSYWPGGVFPGVLPEHAVSRAYLKMAEALAWSELPVKPGDEVAEIGCTPGGASQALLERGLTVMGIDPALPDERVLGLPNFRHVRKRGHEVKRREFRSTKWLTADMNVAPQYTLDTVEAIVTHPAVHIQGLLLTLKLLDWSLAEQIPKYLSRIQSWGYHRVAARQLSHNRQEICLAALRRKAE